MASPRSNMKGLTPTKITIPENVSEFYVNALFVGTTGVDFMLLFGSMTLPATIAASIQQQIHSDIRVDVVIRMSPQQAKASLMNLARVVKDYEAQYGEIRIPLPPGEQEVKNANTP